MTAEMAAGVDTNLSSLEFWARPRSVHHEAFRWLRENRPVSWHGPPEALDPNLDNARGFWSVVKHAHIREISRRADVFSSADGVFVDDFPQLETMLSFIVTDPPRHTEMRNIVSVAFTPKHTRKVEEDTRRTVREILDEVAPRGEGDLCELITKEVPGRVFATFFGIIDRERIQYVMDLAEQLGSWSDPEYSHIGSPLAVFADASARLGALALEMAKERKARPTDDLMSWVAAAEYEGQKLSVEEVGVFFALLAGAANDTTRHSMAHVLALFAQHPDQLAYVFEDFENRSEDAINECLRFEPPLMHFRRTALSDYEIGGETIKEGDKVVLWYMSGNRDGEVFPEPDRFDVTRPTKYNPHQAFGGGGPHYCLGSHLGKQMLRAEMWEIYTRMKDLKVGERDIMLSNFMNGVKRLPATWTPERRA
ncbi:cytochrome P450 [Pseudonocardia eucalypti]|uniref:Cytochrome P450 n=1 Tax=Pseudonocardia eucalypti TaxID=648755 RepID=A0ABP9RC14_9PSEU|nr:cytochrome P450 [Pseudonocardia eucalypti]